jgi:hypothetical protein
MTAHGTISLWTALQYRATGPQAGAAPDNGPRGFRHFLKDPDFSQRFAIDGVPFDPKDLSQLDAWQ